MAERRDVRVGDGLPALTTEPLSRTTPALYGGASGDHNPVHADIDFARRAIQTANAAGQARLAGDADVALA